MSRHRAAVDTGSSDSGDDPKPKPRPGPVRPPEQNEPTEPNELTEPVAPDEPDEAETDETVQSDGPATRRIWLRKPVLLTAMAVLAIVAIVFGVVAIRRDDTSAGGRSSVPATSGAGLTSPAAAQAFVAGATADVTAVTAYDYRSLDIALSTALAVTTGSYRQAYRAAITGPLGARARAQQIVQTFDQTAAGIGSMDAKGGTAKVLIFGRQSVVRGTGAPVTTAVSLTATVVRQGDRYLISRLEAGTNAGLPPGTAQLADAAETARSHVLDSLTLRRSTVDADYTAALADTVEPRRTALTATLAPERQAVARGAYQLTGQVTAIAVERVVSNAVSLLVAATGEKTTGGATSVVTDARLRVTVVRTATGWAVSDAQPVGG